MYTISKPRKPSKTIKIYKTKFVKSFKDIADLATEKELSPNDISIRASKKRVYITWCDDEVENPKYNEQMEKYKIALTKYVDKMKPLLKRALAYKEQAAKRQKELEKYYDEATALLYNKSEKK